jgi:hypothetical protein
LAEDVAAFLRVHCLGVDVLAEDISRSWRESPLAIIEINAGPGVFMHLAPAKGGSIDAPGAIIRSLFPTRRASRIPILTFAELSPKLREVLERVVQAEYQKLTVGCASREGVFVNSAFFTRQKTQWAQVSVLLRHEHLDMAILEYHEDDILDDGLRYDGADIVCLVNGSPTQRVLGRDVEENGWVFVTADQLPLEDLNSVARVCLIDPDGEYRDPPEPINCLATLVDGVPTLVGIDSRLNSVEGEEELAPRERLVVAALRATMPEILESYAPAREDRS